MILEDPRVIRGVHITWINSICGRRTRVATVLSRSAGQR